MTAPPSSTRAGEGDVAQQVAVAALAEVDHAAAQLPLGGGFEEQQLRHRALPTRSTQRPVQPCTQLYTLPIYV
jgi:hypothetical protein